MSSPETPQANPGPTFEELKEALEKFGSVAEKDAAAIRYQGHVFAGSDYKTILVNMERREPMFANMSSTSFRRAITNMEYGFLNKKDMFLTAAEAYLSALAEGRVRSGDTRSKKLRELQPEDLLTTEEAES